MKNNETLLKRIIEKQKFKIKKLTSQIESNNEFYNKISVKLMNSDNDNREELEEEILLSVYEKSAQIYLEKQEQINRFIKNNI